MGKVKGVRRRWPLNFQQIILKMHRRQLGKAMEESFQRFSHLPEKIFEELDNVSIAKCRKVNRRWRNYLEDGKVLQIKIIRSTVRKFHYVGKSWEAAFKTLNTARRKELENENCYQLRREINMQ